MPPPRLPSAISRPAASLRAFSLIELLVVTAIVGVLSGLATVTMSNIGRASSARGAAEITASMVMAARIEATSFGYGSLLVIDNGSNPERKLRRVAVLRYTNTPVSGNPGANTEIAGHPAFLPKGAFFLPDYSTSSNTFILTSLPDAAFTEVIYFKFDAAGHLESPRLASFVFSGNVMDQSGNLQNPEKMIEGRRGFLLRNNGRPVFFKTSSQMPETP